MAEKLWQKLKNFVSGADYDEDYDDEYEEDYYEDSYEDDDDGYSLPPIRSYRTSRTTQDSGRTSSKTTSARSTSSARSTLSRNTISLQTAPRSSSSSRSAKIMNINTNVNMQVLVATPKSMEEAGELCAQLKQKKTIIVNLENVEHDTAQRISDFLCGANYALDGTIQLISGEIFVICPIDVEISSQLKEDLRTNAIQLTYN